MDRIGVVVIALVLLTEALHACVFDSPLQVEYLGAYRCRFSFISFTRGSSKSQVR
jgi:hypothetical protein